MTTERFVRSKLPRLVFISLLLLGLHACGSGKVRDASPMVRVNELSHQQNTMNLQLGIRNVNDEALDTRAISLELKSGEQVLLAWSGSATLNIAANGTETWSVSAAESALGRELLESLQNGAVMSLPYDLQGSIETLESGSLRFETEGHIYPLPGKPGHFR